MESPEQLLTAEESYIHRTSLPYNQNGRSGSGPRVGFRHTEAAKLKMSLALKGKPKPAGFGAVMSRIRLGKPLSPEHRAAIGRGRLGHKDSPATIAKRVASYKLAVARRHAAAMLAVV